MHRYLIILMITIVTETVEAQNAQQFTHFMFNQLVYNPSFAGFDNSLHLNAFYRSQWTGIEGNPVVQSFSVHAPLFIARSNAGLYVVNDQMGAQRVTHFQTAYAYRQPLPLGNLSVGMSAGFFQQQIKGSQLRAPEGNYESSINHNDNFIPAATTSDMAPEFHLGLYLNVKGLQVGISANNITASKTIQGTPIDKTEIRFARYYTLHAIYEVQLGRRFLLLPSAIMKTDFLLYQTDFNVLLQYRDNIYLGSSFRGNTRRNMDAVAVMLGTRIIKNLRLGYSYDITLSSLAQVGNGSHEVYAYYVVELSGPGKPGKKIYNPRFL